MNREIIFRGKAVLSHQWVYGFYIHLRCGRDNVEKHLIQTIEKDGTRGLTYYVVPGTVGQYTGLTDKNGAKIFEDDIIKGAWSTVLEVFF